MLEEPIASFPKHLLQHDQRSMIVKGYLVDVLLLVR